MKKSPATVVTRSATPLRARLAFAIGATGGRSNTMPVRCELGVRERRNGGGVQHDAGEVWLGGRVDRRQPAVGPADVAETRVAAEVERVAQCGEGADLQTGHAVEEGLEVLGVVVDAFEQAGCSGLDLVLR